MKNFTLFFIALFFCHIAFAQNSALRFDGNTEHLTLPHNNNYNIGNGFTIEAWILAEEWKQNQWEGSIVNKDGQGPDRGFAFRCGNEGILSFVMAVDNEWQEAFTSPIMNANQWHHVAAVVDNGTITLYVDGQASATQTFSGTPSENDFPINIGASPNFGGRNFFGVIDEVRIWDDARTTAELNDNMTVDLTGAEANLVGYFQFNEGEGTVAGDISSTSNNAQLVDMDDTNWVDGYTLPDFDISVQRVYGIDVVNMKNRPVKFNTDIQNSGLENISGFDLEVYIDEEFIFSETVSSPIAAGELLNYEFIVPIDLTSSDNPEIEVRSIFAADENSLNNSATTSVVAGSSNRVVVSNNEQHNFGNAGQLNTKLITMPGDLYKYEQILMHIAVNCPTGGCDPWDQYGNIMVSTPSGTFELARFITPYGISCGNWVVDITDYKSILTGQVTFRNFIQVWGASGWLLDAQIELVDNNSANQFSVVSPLWENSYLVYGDPGISHDLEKLTVGVNSNTENSHVRMTITGHGQGNTNNAAEFFEVDHTLEIDGSAFDNHNLWKADCADNVCDNQAGNWLFPRAGWCPGQEVAPYIVNTTTIANAGGDTEFDYVLQDYTNLLNTGYNNSGHTEPHYKIYSYFIEESSTPFSDYENLMAESVEGVLTGNEFASAIVKFTNNGFDDLDNYTINIFNNNELVATQDFNEVVAVDASIEKEITVGVNVNLNEGNSVYAEVVNSLDDNPGDNVVKVGLTTSAEELLASYNFEIFPNPTSDGQVQLKYDGYWEGSKVSIFSADGKSVKRFLIDGNSEMIDLNSAGLFWYQLTHPEGGSLSGKIISVK